MTAGASRILFVDNDPSHSKKDYTRQYQKSYCRYPVISDKIDHSNHSLKEFFAAFYFTDSVR